MESTELNRLLINLSLSIMKYCACATQREEVTLCVGGPCLTIHLQCIYIYIYIHIHVRVFAEFLQQYEIF